MKRTAIMVSVWVAISACTLGNRNPREAQRPKGTKQLRELLIGSAPPEGTQGGMLSPDSPTLLETLRQIHEVVNDSSIKGLFVRFGAMGGSWARTDDLAAAFSAVRKSGKPVHCHFDATDNAGYALAARSCDRLSMGPAGDINLVGIAAQAFFAKQLFENVGLHAELLQVGRFKGSPETFMRSDISPELRASLEAIVTDLQNALLGAIATGRKVSRSAASQLLDNGPYDSSAALAARLVDAVAFDDEARELAKRAARAEQVFADAPHKREKSVGIFDLLKALKGDQPPKAPEAPHVALVQVEGNIMDGEEEGVDGVNAGPLVRELRRLADEPNVRAVVLRIDSPGGSALASDRMWQAVRRVAARKPVVASIGDMAASGGYYVASGARRIIAQKSSLVGSIGVFGGKVSAEQLASRVGVHAVTLQRSRRASWMSPARPFSDDERAALQRLLDSTYRRFLARVASGRKRTTAEVSKAAEGRLWTAAASKPLGLVDEFGGLSDALRWARSEGHLPKTAPVEIWPPRKTLIDTLANAVGGQSKGEALSRGLSEVSGLGPFPNLSPFMPLLLGRERTLAALPFVLTVR